MIIHLIASKGNIREEIDHYRNLANEIKKLGHTLALDWVEHVYEKTVKGSFNEGDVDWAKIDQETTAAISKADVIIVEATKKSFFVGYQVSQTVHQKKPILILTRDNSFPGIASLSSTSDLIAGANYDKTSLPMILKRFTDDNSIDTKDMRFNFFIDRPIYNYLRWAAFKTGKTKAEILRELVAREIDKNNSNQL
jgi:hypothetical protein